MRAPLPPVSALARRVTSPLRARALHDKGESSSLSFGVVALYIYICIHIRVHVYALFRNYFPRSRVCTCICSTAFPYSRTLYARFLRDVGARVCVRAYMLYCAHQSSSLHPARESNSVIALRWRRKMSYARSLFSLLFLFPSGVNSV